MLANRYTFKFNARAKIQKKHLNREDALKNIDMDNSKTIDIMIQSRHTDEFSIRRSLHDFVAANSLPDPTPSADPISIKLFVYWGQGFERAPAIVKACQKRLYHAVFDAEIIELTDTNIQNWTDIPGYIFDKLEDDRTHFSDILRCELLTRHGGIWMDATCYLKSSPAPLMSHWLKDSDFAAYRRNESDLYMLSSWFMMARSSALIPSALRHYLFEYWRVHHKKAHYFILHFLFEAIYNQNAQFRRSWDNGVKFDAYLPHQLQHHLAHSYSDELFTKLLSNAVVHKLTYKTDLNRDDKTIYSHIISSN